MKKKYVAPVILHLDVCVKTSVLTGSDTKTFTVDYNHTIDNNESLSRPSYSIWGDNDEEW